MSSEKGPADTLKVAWEYLSPVPFGRYIFSRLLGFMVPYSGSISPDILELKPGYAKIQVQDQRSVRNHLDSIHAIALMNLGEMSTGLAMMFGMPRGARAILTNLSIEYLKKARGTITAECHCEPPKTKERHEYEYEATLTDKKGHVVARAKARWLVGPPGRG